MTAGSPVSRCWASTSAVRRAEPLRSREPGCRVVLREARPGQVAAWLRDGEAEVCLAAFPLEELDRVSVVAGESGATAAELLTLVGAGEGVRGGAHPPLPRATRRRLRAAGRRAAAGVGLAWRAGAETARVRAFTRAAVDLLAAG